MSPQSTLTPVRRVSTSVLDLTHDFAPPRPMPKTDLLPPVVIRPAPAFEQARPLNLVEFEPRRSADTRRSAETQRAPKTLTAGHIRLTRRGRLVLLIAAVLCMLLGFLLGDTLSFKGGTISPPAASHSIVVQPGQTLWGIATQVAPHADPRATVQQIIVLNHLPSTSLQAGETLAVPS
jgi:LysM repeat protein